MPCQSGSCTTTNTTTGTLAGCTSSLLPAPMQSPTLLSLAASPWPQTQPDATSRDPCGNIAHHPACNTVTSLVNPVSNSDTPSADAAAMQSSHAQTCGTEDGGVALPQGCGNGMATLLTEGSKRPGSGKASDDTHNILNPDLGTMHQVIRDHTPSSPATQNGIFEAEFRKGSKHPDVGTPSPTHNSVPDSATLSHVDISVQSKDVEFLGGHGQESPAKEDGHSFVKVGDSSNLENILARYPGAGSPSKGHNSVTDGVASE